MNKTLTINELNKSNANYDINHFRYSKKRAALLPLSYFRMTKNQVDIEPKGGMTTVHVRFPDGRNYYSLAECTKTDAFKNSLGVQIALSRIQKQMEN